MPTKVFTAVVTVLLCSISPVLAAEQPDFTGTWELVRVDGLKPQDAPPAGVFPKLIVELGDSGHMRYWFVGEENDPSDGTYSIRNGKFSGWLSLSNDFDTPRALNVPADGWMELSFPEGFVATFRRVPPGEDVDLFCAFYTVVGYNYDADQVARLKEATFHFQPAPIPQQLTGRWRAQQGFPEMGTFEVDLTIRDDRAHLIVRSVDPPLGTIGDDEGAIEVSGEYLRSPAIACGAVHHYSLDDGILEMVNSAEQPMRLGPAE